MELAISSDVEVNKYSTNDINNIRNVIEGMNKFNQIEVLRILHTKCVINENKYGSHINLSDVETETIDELSIFIKYVNAQENSLHLVEQQKADYKNIYFAKDNKDNC